jgi:hypothetical protein
VTEQFSIRDVARFLWLGCLLYLSLNLFLGRWEAIGATLVAVVWAQLCNWIERQADD